MSCPVKFDSVWKRKFYSRHNQLSKRGLPWLSKVKQVQRLSVDVYFSADVSAQVFVDIKSVYIVRKLPENLSTDTGAYYSFEGKTFPSIK